MSPDKEAGAWLTLTEAALRLGTSPDALRKQIKRGKLSASRSNDGRPRVWVVIAHPTTRLREAPAIHGYLEAIGLPVLAARLRRRAPERYEGLRTLAKD